MNLSKTNRMARLFWACDSVWDKFRDGHTKYVGRETNLCYFMRVIIVWAPLVLTLHLALVAGAAYVAAFLPLHYFGWTTYRWALAAIGTLGVLIWATSAFFRWAEKHGTSEKRLALEPTTSDESTPKEPGFIAIFFAWLKAKKEKICPTIHFTERT